MISAAAFRGCMAGALLLAVGWKAAIQIESQGSRKDALVTFLERNDFDVATTVVSDVSIVHATAASCRLQVIKLSPDGSNRDLVRHLTEGHGRSFVVFGGVIYAQQPILRTVFGYLWSRFVRELGFADRVGAPLSVTASPSCDAERLPWSELGPP